MTTTMRHAADNETEGRGSASPGCSSGEPEPPAVPNDEPAAGMTNERRATERRSTLLFPSNTSLTTPFSSVSSASVTRHWCCAVFTICLLMSGTIAAPAADRHERPPTLEILDGYVNYSIINASSPNPDFHEISKNAFLSLKGTPVEARLRLGYQLESSESHVEHLTRHHRKKNRKPVGKLKKGRTDEQEEVILDGRKHAILQLANQDALNMNQRCDGQKFKQRIRVDGCLTKVVVNRLCHGTCASIFIPRMHSKKLKAAFRSCAACAPADYDFVDITLDCPGRDPPTATKTIVKVKSCKCREVRISPL